MGMGTGACTARPAAGLHLPQGLPVCQGAAQVRLAARAAGLQSLSSES